MESFNSLPYLHYTGVGPSHGPYVFQVLFPTTLPLQCPHIELFVSSGLGGCREWWLWLYCRRTERGGVIGYSFFDAGNTSVVENEGPETLPFRPPHVEDLSRLDFGSGRGRRRWMTNESGVDSVLNEILLERVGDGWGTPGRAEQSTGRSTAHSCHHSWDDLGPRT